MKQFRAFMLALLIVLLCSLFSPAQQSVATPGNAAVPPLIPFSSVAADNRGSALSGVVNITFSLYAAQQGGEPLWTETQNNIELDANGRYSVQLGVTQPNGVPTTLFTSGEARWLGVQIAEQGEQPRVLLLSVPYALKAGDAATIGGLPPSAFVLAAPGSGSGQAPMDAGAVPQNSNAQPTNGPVTGVGTTGYLPVWDATSDIVDSVLFQAGTGATTKIGINNPTPAATLDVAGSSIIRGTFELPNTGTATATAGKNSQPFAQVASAFNSTSGKAVTQTFEWQAEPANNDTPTVSATLNLLFGSGTTKPAETGFHIASDGLITFATGQTFPGGGDGTITGVTAGTDLTGGGTNGGVTLNLDTTKVPQLGSANAFVGNQTITGNITDSGNISATGSVTAQNGVINNTSSVMALSITDSVAGSVGINLTGNANVGIDVTAVNQGIVATATAALNGVGVSGMTTGGTAIQGQDDAGSGLSVGVLGSSSSTFGIGVTGEAVNSTSTAAGTGVLGTAAGPDGIGVAGEATATNSTDQSTGVYGSSTNQTTGIGVEGVATGVAGHGGLFEGGPSGPFSSQAWTGGPGVEGFGGNDATAAGNGGGMGAIFEGGSSNSGMGGEGGQFFGGYTNSTSGAAGGGIVALAGQGLGSSGGAPIAGVAGYAPFSITSGAADGPGVYGTDGTISANGSANYLNTDIGVWGDTGSGFAGVVATAENAYALVASNSTDFAPTVKARNRSTTFPSTAQGLVVAVDGISGQTTIGGAGCNGQFWGLQLGQAGMSGCTNYTMLGDGVNTYINAGNGSTAGTINFRINNNFSSPAMTVNTNGSVSIATLDVTKTLTKPAGSFKIDHPLDPANKYLYHSFVESPDMKNIYDGVAVLDGNGEAVVPLPDYFDALNSDFRYQLTTIGGFAPVYIAAEIQNNQFKIAGGKPGIKVSWQVTGTRQDAFAKAYRIQAEVDKAPEDRGHYLHPELFGAPETARIGYTLPVPPEYARGDGLEKRPEPRPSSEAAAPRRTLRPRPPLPVLPKIPAVKVPAKPLITTQASK
jgi:trimeric autotransporter adhesin